MSNFTLKEKIATLCCFMLAALMFGVALYEFIVIEFVFRDMLSFLGICLMFIGLGLNPKIFFVSIKEATSVNPPEGLVPKRVHETLVFTGVGLSVFTTLWRFLS